MAGRHRKNGLKRRGRGQRGAGEYFFLALKKTVTR